MINEKLNEAGKEIRLKKIKFVRYISSIYNN